jgi:metacaspase-1
MAIGIALHIGLNSVDPHKYEGWSGPLNACEADANDMADLAHTQGFAAAKLLTKKATRDAVLKGIADAAKKLKGGHLLPDVFRTRRAGAGPQRRRARRQGRDVVPL